MKNNEQLLLRAKEGDLSAKDELVTANLGLVHHIVKRFIGRGVEAEDLFQIGSIGLLKAIDHFDMQFGVQFSTYAVPMIQGEIKRFLRDDGMIKVSRSLKELSYKAYAYKEEMVRKQGREPTLSEIAKKLEVTMEELTMALESATEVESLQKTVYQSDNSEIELQDKLPEKENIEEKLINHIVLGDTLRYLEKEERQLIWLRYFKEKTQSEVGRIMGISQVQVSRYEKKILNGMREKLAES